MARPARACSTSTRIKSRCTCTARGGSCASNWSVRHDATRFERRVGVDPARSVGRRQPGRREPRRAWQLRSRRIARLAAAAERAVAVHRALRASPPAAMPPGLRRRLLAIPGRSPRARPSFFAPALASAAAAVAVVAVALWLVPEPPAPVDPRAVAAAQDLETRDALLAEERARHPRTRHECRRHRLARCARREPRRARSRYRRNRRLRP